MPRINWDRVDAIRRAHGWTWAEIARRIGISAPHLSDMRAERRTAGGHFVDCLCVALDLRYDEALLPLPKLHGKLSARDILGIASLEDGRPWPVRYSRDVDLGEAVNTLSIEAKKVSDAAQRLMVRKKQENGT